MTGTVDGGRAAMAAAAVILCAPAAWAHGQHSGAHLRARAAARSADPLRRITPPGRRTSAGLPRNPKRPRANASSVRAPATRQPRRVPRLSRLPRIRVRPIWVQAFPVPLIRGMRRLSKAPPGHLGDWLNQHRNLPVQEQERMLRGDPSFRRLPPAEQQRVVRAVASGQPVARGAAAAPPGPRRDDRAPARPRSGCGSTSPRAAGPRCRRTVRR